MLRLYFFSVVHYLRTTMINLLVQIQTENVHLSVLRLKFTSAEEV